MDSQWHTVLDIALADLRFGSVEIVVHDGRISQIEKRERFRVYQETQPISETFNKKQPTK